MSQDSMNKRSVDTNVNQEQLDNLDASLKLQADEAGNLVKPSKNKKILFAAIPVVVVCLLAAIFYGWQYFSSHEETDDAYVDAHTSAISARIAGTIASVYVTDNQIVKVGDLIAELDSRDYAAKVEQSQAQVHLMQGQLDQSIASLTQATKNADAQITESASDHDSASANEESIKSLISQNMSAVNEQRAQIRSMDAKLKMTHNDYERYLQLDANDAVSKQELDQKRTDYEMAEAQLQAANDALRQNELKVIQSKSQLVQAKAQVARSFGLIKAAEATQEQVKVINKQIIAAKASYDQAQAQLKQDLLKLSYCKIQAPIDGRIGRKNLEVGNHVDIGQNLISIVSSDTWITANFKETQTSHMSAGQKVEINIDALPDSKIEGYVDSMAPASGAKFALLPPENATGNFTKVVQRIPVKIAFDKNLNSKIKARLVPGMSCRVVVLTK